MPATATKARAQSAVGTRQSRLSSAQIEALKQRLADRNWRLANLYRIVDKYGNDIQFVPNATQRAFLAELHNRNVTLKSRQHGFTTLAALLALDTALFRRGTSCGLVMHKREDAQKVFTGKIMYAYDRLPAWLRETRTIKHRDNTGVVEFSNGSKIEVSLSHRGGTLQYLHVSEYGPMCAMFPQRAQELKTGALNTVAPDGIVTIESTAYGRFGDFYQLCDRSRRLSTMIEAGTAKLTSMDYQFHFFAWHEDDGNVLDPDGVPISTELKAYFKQLHEQHDVKLTAAKKAWYAKKAEEQGDKMKREHPSTPDEAFEQAIEGAYFGKEMGKAFADGRVCDLPIIPGVPVNTFWDIGFSDSTSIWFHQAIGPWHHFIDFYANSGEQVAHYVQVLQERGYRYGKHYLPHDGINTDWSGRDNESRKQVIAKLGIKPVELVPRVDNIQDGIDMVRRSLARCRFDRTRCGEDPPGSGRGGIPSMLAYRKAWNEQLSTYHDYPLHDWASDGADAFRQFSQGFPLNGINDEMTRQRTRSRDRNWRTA
ncbi:MAG: hypothetical protein L0H83_07315 [Salinisphaera sp.]|nr:hypothetical protein [Salinisphaera sp.]